MGIVIKARKKARECKAKAVIEIYGNLIGHINSSFHDYHIGNDNTLKRKSQYTAQNISDIFVSEKAIGLSYLLRQPIIHIMMKYYC